jgi:hypothetical protein
MIRSRSGLVITLLLGAAMLLPCGACAFEADHGEDAEEGCHRTAEGEVGFHAEAPDTCVSGCDHSSRSDHTHSVLTSSRAPKVKRGAPLAASSQSLGPSPRRETPRRESPPHHHPVLQAIRTVVLLV